MFGWRSTALQMDVTVVEAAKDGVKLPLSERQRHNSCVLACSTAYEVALHAACLHSPPARPQCCYFEELLVTAHETPILLLQVCSLSPVPSCLHSHSDVASTISTCLYHRTATSILRTKYFPEMREISHIQYFSSTTRTKISPRTAHHMTQIETKGVIKH